MQLTKTSAAHPSTAVHARHYRHPAQVNTNTNIYSRTVLRLHLVRERRICVYNVCILSTLPCPIQKERLLKVLSMPSMEAPTVVHRRFRMAIRLSRAGVRASDGDGTVPLLSLGALCARHWREPRLNPSGMRVVSREFAHEPFYGLGEIRCAVWPSSAV